MNDKFFEENLKPLEKRSLNPVSLDCQKLFLSTLNHLHMLTRSKIFFQVQKSWRKNAAKHSNYFYLVFFHQMWDEISAEDGGRFHHEIKTMKNRYQGRIRP